MNDASHRFIRETTTVPEAADGLDRTRTSVDAVQGLASGALLAGRYRILGLAGVGGMGMVYSAHDEQLDLPVAVKVLRPEMAIEPRFLDRFRKELVLARQVTHRNAVRIHDMGHDEENGLLFLTMDFVPGRSLREVLEEEGETGLGVERAVEITRQLALALEAAHAEGVVHRDLKPANVLVDGSGRAYVTDFGVARSLHATGLTRPGAIVGTLDYLSPEQARGDEVDARSDLYSLGILLFEMLSGELPFEGGSESEVLARHLTGNPRDLRQTAVEVPDWLRKVVGRLLARDPRRRYQSAGELIADLDRNRASRRPWRRALPWAAIALVLGCFAFAAWTFLSGKRPQGAEVGPPPAGLAPRHAIIVLPLANETGRPDLAWASAGLAEMITDTLAESPALRVVDSLRVLRTLDDLKLPRGPLAAADLRRLAELLDADRVVSGHLRAAGDRLRVDLDLIAADLPALPARRLHAEVDGVSRAFRLVEKLGADLSDHLEVASSEPAQALTFASPAALAAYAQGLEQLLRGNAVAAAPALERAVAADPGFSAAWLRLARAHQELGRRNAAVEAAQRAVASLGESRGRLAYESRALSALLSGDPASAQTLLTELSRRYPNDVEARIALAEARGEQGKLEPALQVLREAVRLDPQHPRAWFLLGRYSIEAGDFRRAIDEYLVHALILQNRLGNLQGQADVLNATGVAYGDMGDPGRAADYYRRAAEIRRRIGDERGYAITLRNLADHHLARGELKTAERELGEALEILERIGDHAGVAEVYNDYGALAEERGNYREALEQFRRSLRARRDLGDELALAQSYENVAYAYYLFGRYDDAMVYWRQGLELYRRGGSAAGIMTTTQSMGQLQLAQGEWDDALKSFLEALRRSRELGKRDGVAVSKAGLGRLAQVQGRLGAAESSYAEAIALLRQPEDRRGLVEYTLAQADLDLEIGDWKAAGENLEAAARWLAEDGNHEQQAERLRLSGELLLAQGESAAALGQLRQAIAEAEASHSTVALLSARLSTERAILFRDERRGLGPLRELLAQAEELEHSLLALRAREALGRAALGRGDLSLAEETLRVALAHLGDRPYGGAYRLHRLLAETLTRLGRPSEAATEQQRAATELSRLRSELTSRQRPAFDAIPEVYAFAPVPESKLARMPGSGRR